MALWNEVLLPPCSWCAVWTGPHKHLMQDDGTPGLVLVQLDDDGKPRYKSEVRRLAALSGEDDPFAYEPKVTVNRDDVQAIVDWWRGANEAPGGCSFQDAIKGMKDAVWRLDQELRRGSL